MTDEYTTLTDDQKAAVDEMVRISRQGRLPVRRIFPDLEAEAYAYPHSSNSIAWGLDHLNGVNFKRGIVE
ncbi:MAG TPA: hypothetical protein VFU31_29765 [Candidatus Binatia bacterium]|nr:hypothetical protein [Candidatus Binatia bacterium]